MNNTISFIRFALCFLLSLPLAFAQNEPVTLRLAVADGQGRPSEPYVLEFIEQVETLSDGSITIEPIWGAGYDTAAYFEAGIVQLVTAGEAELGLTASRAWDNEGVTSLQALQAPFLITNDALAEAVAGSAIATRMLEGMSSAGVVGLMLWPEDLRHPFAFEPFGKTFLSPEEVAGTIIRAIPSSVTWAMIEALGATPIFKDDYVQDVVDGRIQGAESGLLAAGYSLPVAATATGNVVFFPKFQVLFANGEAFEQLSEEQQMVIRNAAAATQDKAITEHPREADAAAQWCADGGTIVLASDEQVAAFEEAARPVFDQIEQDPTNAELIAAIRDLKANTEPSAGAEECGQAATQQTPEPTADTGVWSQGLPPNGTWQVELTVEDFMGMGVMRPSARDWAGVYTLTLQDGQAVIEVVWPGGGSQRHGEVTYAVVEDFVRFAGAGSNVVEDLRWRLEEDGLHFHVVATRNAPFIETKALYEAKPWQKID
jgi:TRAP-type transport system periplasmic protein